MQKKISIVLSLLATFCLVFTGCGAAQETDSAAGAEETAGDTSSDELVYTDDTVHLTIWGAEEDADLLAQIASDFQTTYSNQKFEIEIGACSEANCKDQVLDDVANAADVFTFADDQLSSLVASGLMKAVSYNLDDVTARNSASSVDAASLDGVLYAYPLTADNGYFMYYNKAYFDAADLETLDGMLAVAASNGKTVTMDLTSGWYLYSFYGNTGLEVGINDDGISNYCTWNSTDNSITGVDVANALMALGSNSGFKCGGDDALLAGAADGSVIAGVSGVWNSTSMAELWGDNLGAVKLPTYTVAGQQVQMSSYAGYKMMGVNSYSENVQWAEAFADFATNEQNQTLRFTMRGQGPSNTAAASSEDVTASPAIVALIQQSEFASLQRIGANYWSPAGELGQSMVSGDTGGMELQEYLDKIVADITASNS